MKALLPRLVFRTALIAVIGLGPLLAPRPAGAQGLLDRARGAVRDAARAVEDAAKAAGRSASDFLKENPDLNRDISEFGHKVGVPGIEPMGPTEGAGVIASPAKGEPGSTIVLTARGLPGKQTVIISASPATGEAREIAHSETSTRGILRQAIVLPDWAKDGDRLVFAVETEDRRLRLVSQPFEVAEAQLAFIVTGTLFAGGPECPALRGDDGKLYSLAPSRIVSDFALGDRITVIGARSEMSICQQGTTIAVEAAAPARTPDRPRN